jgi:HAE1 family hydrophobic/amphiphilic exporter-1
MDVLKLAITRPVSVAVGVVLIVMAGLVGFSAVPIQLAPNVDRPEITVTTSWVGRSPDEIVEEIVKKQEEELKNVANLDKMTSTSSDGQGVINLEFAIDTEMARALQEVSDSLRQVSDIPDDAEEPVIEAADGASENAIAWIIIDVDPEKKHLHPDFDVQTLYTSLDKQVKPLIERVDGVAEVNIFGGRERELRVLVDATRLAQYGLNHLQVIDAIEGQNLDISAGTIAEGKRDVRIRVLGQYESPDDVLETIIDYRDGGPVYVKDVADVEVGYEKRRGFVRSLAQPAIAMNVIRQSGSNVMEVMAGVRARLAEIDQEVRPKLDAGVGDDLRIRQVYDETIYIDSAIALVTQNLWLGGIIAGLVLLLFLRSFVATGVVALAIPVSVVGTFVVLLLLGRTLNVISLAGLAFAVGMVVDNAIVVLENIFRHRQMGKTPARAAYDGGREVIGAIVAATLTTVAVFIPVLTVQEEAGQLFRDIALAIVASVSLSLLVSVTVIPSATAKFLGHAGEKHERGGWRRRLEDLFGLAPFLTRLGHWIADAVYWLITGWRGWTIRPALIVVMMVASLGGAWLLKPPMDYLPAGNRNLVFGGINIPPGYSVEQMEKEASRIERVVEPYMEAYWEGGTPDDGFAPIPRRGFGGATPEPFAPVAVDNFFVGSRGGSMFGGAVSANPEIVVPVGQLLTNAFGAVPDAFGGASQSSLFGRGVGGGGAIDIEIMGPDLARVTAAAGAIFGRLMQDESYGPGSVRPTPGNFNKQQQEFVARLSPMGRELGMNTVQIGTAVRALFDGAFAGEYTDRGDTIDINVVPHGGRLSSKEAVVDIPVATPRGPTVSLDQLVEFEPDMGPQQIRRIEEQPAITIGVKPPDGVPLERVMRDLNDRFVGPVRETGLIDRTMRVRMEGTAAQLDEVQQALLGERESNAAIWRLDQRWETWGGLRRAVALVFIALLGAGLLTAAWACLQGVRKHRFDFLYGGAGAVLIAGTLAALGLAVVAEPSLGAARFVWASLVVYLLMCALFESFTYPFVIMFSVPLALVGGFAGLAIVHHVTDANPIIATQNLDVLTMLGFVILVGVVVNNAILIVHQSLNLMAGKAEVVDKEGGVTQGRSYEPLRAVSLAVSTRIRPVFMSTMTSVGGMLPLVVMPGAGSELYRGLGSVVVGGLLVATVFTLVLVPLVFSITLEMLRGLKAVFGASTSVGAVEAATLERELTGAWTPAFAANAEIDPDRDGAADERRRRDGDRSDHDHDRQRRERPSTRRKRERRRETRAAHNGRDGHSATSADETPPRRAAEGVEHAHDTPQTTRASQAAEQQDDRTGDTPAAAPPITPKPHEHA